MMNKTIEVIARAQRARAASEPEHCCTPVPEFKRLKYFYGQMLGALDLQAEQDYFREKLKLHNRCLHGYGTVCGLEVVPEPSQSPCDSPADDRRAKLEEELKQLAEALKKAEASGVAGEAEKIKAKMEEIRRALEQLPPATCKEEIPTRVVLECGIAIDCEGNEIVVRRPVTIDLWRELNSDDRKRVQAGETTLYVSICFCAQPVDPVRPVLPDACGASPECIPGKLRDAFRVTVSVDPPPPDTRCDVCCCPCPSPCLLLARIDHFKPGQPLLPELIDNAVRRMLGLYTPARITGISWSHNADYSADEARKILGADDPKSGLTIRFSKPVLTETIARGVVDLWVIEGGRGRSGNIYHMAGEYVDTPSAPTTTVLKYRQASGETLQEGDRVLIIVRTNFILDECCRPVDGDNTGGRVPSIDSKVRLRDRIARAHPCDSPPHQFGAWTSGNGTAGGTFESWFYIDGSEGAGHSKPA